MKFKLKKFWLIGVASLLGASSILAQPATTYVNNAILLSPPQIPPTISATSFLNSNVFTINYTNGLPFLPPPITPLPYETSDTLNFTNGIAGILSCNMGFTMEMLPTYPSYGNARRAANIFNAGTINSGTSSLTNLFTGEVKFFANATNIISPGRINMGFDSVLKMIGGNVDLNRGTITAEDNGLNIFNGFTFLNNGMFDGYWGVGTTNTWFAETSISPPAYFNGVFPVTPYHAVTNRDFTVDVFHRLNLQSAATYVSETQPDISNRVVRVVFVSNTNSQYPINVYFPLGATVVEWAASTNITGASSNRFLYLYDYFGFETNLYVAWTGRSAGNTLNLYNLTYQPWNYVFARQPQQNYGLAAAPGLPAGTFLPGLVTNQYTAYRGLFLPISRVLDDVAGQTVTNLPGRIEISADTSLDLTRAKITGQNYLQLRSTNHLVSTSRAAISSPWSDMTLRSTNGSLTISNLIAPTVLREEGIVDLWSGRWTNVTAGFGGVFVTNSYHVLFVDSKLSPYVPSRIQDLALRSTNTAGGSDEINISDSMNISRNLLLDCQRLTITTNVQPAPAPRGEINLLSDMITWSDALPRLQHLTNNGTIKTFNAVFFGGSRTTPYYGSNYTEAYQSFVNRGSVFTENTAIWANYFYNSGVFDTGLGNGSFALTTAEAFLTNGSIVALKGDLSIVSSGNLTITNHLLQSGYALTLSVSNRLTDGITNTPQVTPFTNANNWSVAAGFNLPIKPTTGDLRGTVIYDSAAGGVSVAHAWAGENRGTNSGGYFNNVAIGRLILDGQADSEFAFTGVGVSNAIYVDCIELRNSSTNIDNGGNLPAFNIAPNMTVYYAQAFAGDISVAERINRANGGRLLWVSEYAGLYSSTNLVYPDGSTNAFNAALVQSENLDSDNDGLVNAEDPTPLVANLALLVAITNQPAMGALVSWRTVPNSANTVYYKTSPSGANWIELTNLNVGPFAPERVSIFDPMSSSGSRVYRVKMTPPQP